MNESLDAHFLPVLINDNVKVTEAHFQQILNFSPLKREMTSKICAK